MMMSDTAPGPGLDAEHHQTLAGLQADLETLRTRTTTASLREEQLWPLVQRSALLLQHVQGRRLEGSARVIHSLLDSMQRIARQQRKLRELKAQYELL
jgi:hypothetical protein